MERGRSISRRRSRASSRDDQVKAELEPPHLRGRTALFAEVRLTSKACIDTVAARLGVTMQDALDALLRAGSTEEWTVIVHGQLLRDEIARAAAAERALEDEA